MKKFTFKGVLDGFRQTVQPQAIRQEHEIQETLKAENFAVRKTFRHGFPYSPTAFAFDPVQKLLAIGDKAGNLRILGRPGVDAYVKHEGESACAVILAEFIVNDGALVTVTADDTLHLWSIRQKVPVVVQSLKFQRERVTCIHLPVQSKWLYVGTEKGNIHVVNIDTFALSGYVINWNKAIEVVRATHPGAVIALCDNPLDANKLLMGYESGLLVLWDLKGKFAEIRWQAAEPVKSIAWHYEGKYFVSSHTDGTICSWPTRPTPKPQSLVCPHAKTNKDGALEKCKAIYKVDLKATVTGETYTIFSGGMPTDKGSKSNCITVMVGKTTTVLEMEHAVVDFIILCEKPWTCETQEPYAIAVLLQYDLVLIDLLTSGFPCFESPYPMDLHESPVTCCTYLTDCPSDLVPALYSIGRTTTSKKNAFSEREWPISGGEWSPASCSYSEIVITGHQDGSLKFWDSGAGSLQVLYKFKTAKFFEKPKNITHSSDNNIEFPFAIQIIYLCSESRRLCVAGSMGQVMLFKFRKVETHSSIFVLEIPIFSDYFDDIYGTSPEFDFTPHQVQKSESSDSDKADAAINVKSGPLRIPPGFHPQLFCFTFGPNKKLVQVTSLAVNSSYGLMAYGTEYGLVVIDIIQKNYLLSVACPDLYGGQDPYSRTPKSPKRLESKDEQSRSPSSDQLNDTTSPDSPSIEFIPEVNEEALLSNQNQNSSSRPITPETNDRNAVTITNASLATGLGVAVARTTGGAIPKSPLREGIPTVPAGKDLQERRKSMSWKTFNLKRQLSRVNMKIGIGLNNENEAITGKGGGGSAIFYTQKECSPEEEDQSPSKEPIVVGVECRESMSESIMGDAIDAQSENTFSEDSREQYSRAETNQEIFKKVDFMPESEESDDKQASRPNNLPLVSSGGNASTSITTSAVGVLGETGIPVKPPRQKSKEKRDQRLLSVPNIKYQSRDMRSRTTVRNDSSPSFSGNKTKKTQKLDGSFSRSRSSSMSSIDMSSTESVTCLAFMESFAKLKDVFSLVPTLWIGTSFGSVLTLLFNIPERDVRSLQPISITLNDCSLQLSPTRTPTTANTTSNTSGGNVSSSASSSGISGSVSTGLDTIADRQFVVVASDKQTKVFDIVNQCCVNRIHLSEMDFAVKAETISMKGGTCLVTYLSNGHLLVHSLPSLKLLLDADFLPLMDLSFQTKCKQGIVDPMLSIWGQQIIVHEDTTQISKIFCFSNKGHGLYMASPTEIQKFTISAEFCQFITEMLGSLFTVREMPEQPKESFFKGLFGGGTKSIDREELFGEQSGKANRSVAKHIPGPTLDQLGQRASTAASEISRAHQLAMERGEKLNLLEERAERMANQAQDFSGTAHQLMLRYKDKKWYQL
ncbi:syntaxin-binding protein tomosyn isoform 2-T3 [Glossina fuscipes fuscipes]